MATKAKLVVTCTKTDAVSLYLCHAMLTLLQLFYRCERGGKKRFAFSLLNNAPLFRFVVSSRVVQLYLFGSRGFKCSESSIAIARVIWTALEKGCRPPFLKMLFVYIYSIF